MKKKFSVPSFLLDYTSVWNPLFGAFMHKIIDPDDIAHGLRGKPKVGLGVEKIAPMIDKGRLLAYKRELISLRKNETLFREGTKAIFYFQLEKGALKMVTNSTDGREFIQGIFSSGDSFGEPPLFSNFSYPSTAIALEDSRVIRLPKDNFFNLLQENFDIHLKLNEVLCNRLRYKSMILSDISFHDPEHRIMSLLKHLKGGTVSGDATRRVIRTARPYVVPFTRQQLADMSGLRVETVIRAVKKMQEKGKLEIIGRKITI